MKALKTFLIIAILSMILGACEKEPVKIGFSANLTGTGSELATAALYGVTMAKDEINKAGGIEGRHIELIIRDDNNDADSALQADLELAEEGAVVIIGHMVSSLGRLSVPHTNEVQMPMISPTMSSTVFSEQAAYFFTFIPFISYHNFIITFLMIVKFVFIFI